MDWLDPQLLESLHLGLLGRLLLATVLGGLIGLEREISGKPAGLRTNILICVGATLIMEVSANVAAMASPGQPADPGRIAAQVVSGIGFIGAGTILVARGNVIGLTTAATLWVVAAIGLGIGSHMYIEAAGTTILVFATLVVLGWVEGFILRQRREVTIEVVTGPDPDALDEVNELFRAHGVEFRATEVEKQPDRYRITYTLRGPRAGREGALEELKAVGAVRKARIIG